MANSVIVGNANKLMGAMVVVTAEPLEAQENICCPSTLSSDKQSTHKIIHQVWIQLLHSCKQR